MNYLRDIGLGDPRQSLLLMVSYEEKQANLTHRSNTAFSTICGHEVPYWTHKCIKNRYGYTIYKFYL